MPDSSTTYPLITRDPITGDELLVTRLEGASTGITVEGRFQFGWLGRLTAAQLEFVRLLALYRGNIQKVAADLGIAYNTARTRSDEIAAALNPSDAATTMGDSEATGDAIQRSRLAVLDRVLDGELSVDDALRQLRAIEPGSFGH